MWQQESLVSKLMFAIAMAGIGFGLLHGSDPAFASEWPARPVRAIVPFSAGSAVDIVPRLVFQEVSRRLGEPIVVENRTGAGGTIGTALVAKAAPDGYTLLVNSSSHTIIPSLYPDISYDTLRDFTDVLPLGNLPTVLLVAPSRGFKTLRDLVEAAKAKPGAISYGSAGIGSATHFAAERLRLSAGFEGVHVPFRGAPEAYREVIAGRVDFLYGAIASALPLIRDGRLMALAVSTPTRASGLPDVPTTLELGYANSDYTFWIGMFAPRQTPSDVIEKLHRETAATLHEADMRAKLAKLGVDAMDMSPAAFDALIKAEIASNAVVVKAASIRSE
jgi:tripartite-type tricarboxylate transporter receptor subunit TctC